jgi:hypothetical protein
MVNNSTNINKSTNYLSPKESLNSDGQQFHQYQQIDQTSHLNSLKIKKHHKTCDVGNPGPDLGTHTQMW